VVDAEDLSLNVSRELLQQDRQIKAVRKHLIKRILDSLATLMSEDREVYKGFWEEFGPVIKEGLLDPESKRERVLDLTLTPSTQDGTELTTLAEYVERMGEDQKAIYYLTSPSLEAAVHSPHLEAFRDKGVEVLFFIDPVDSVWLQMSPTYKDKPLQSIGKGEVELGSDALQPADHLGCLSGHRRGRHHAADGMADAAERSEAAQDQAHPGAQPEPRGGGQAQRSVRKKCL
jgi:molecular chaperone HtpG